MDTCQSPEAARLEGARLALRSVEYYLNDRLALTFVCAELLAGDPALPPHVRAWVVEAARRTREAFATLRAMREITHLRETEGLAGTIIDFGQGLVEQGATEDASPHALLLGPGLWGASGPDAVKPE